MIVRKLSAEHFRNLEKLDFSPGPGVNVLYGGNAQGKTNLVEAIWLFTGGRSFRTGRDADLIAFGQKACSLGLRFERAGGQREEEARITVETGRACFLNGLALKSAAELGGHFCAVVFSPDHLSLVKEGPHFRREFLDGALCQLLPRYGAALGEYRRCLSQRNALLKDIPRHSELLDTLGIWDERLCAAGAYLVYARLGYLRGLEGKACENYAGISAGSENFSLAYLGADGRPYEAAPLPGGSGEGRAALAALRGEIAARFKQNLSRDVELGFTQAGPHRDDLDIRVNALPARLYGSQGQQRSAVLSLKLAEASMLKERLGEPPVLLLDDVMSELDGRRRDYLLNHIGGWQVFITCCDPAGFGSLRGGSVFEIRAGAVTGGNVSAGTEKS
jgi:DNA replication and repair protein RecF